MNIRVTKRADMPKKQEYIVRIIAVLLSIVFAGLILLAFGLNPIKIFVTIIKGSIGSKIRLQQTVIRCIPLLITSLGIMVAFKMKFWNIGAEGQITMGALGATWVALHLPETLPAPVMLGAMMLAAVLCGGFWAFIPAIFKAKMGTNETIFTLMMNYIAIKFVTYLQYGPWMDPNAGGFPRIAKFPQNAVLPSLFGANIGWVFGLIFVVLVFFFMNYTKKGYEIAVIGESHRRRDLRDRQLAFVKFVRRPLNAVFPQVFGEGRAEAPLEQTRKIPAAESEGGADIRARQRCGIMLGDVIGDAADEQQIAAEGIGRRCIGGGFRQQCQQAVDLAHHAALQCR